MTRMRRIQVVMDPELDDRLALEARAQGLSKSALIRQYVRQYFESPLVDNGLWRLPTFDDVEPVEDIDTELYGPLEAES